MRTVEEKILLSSIPMNTLVDRISAKVVEKITQKPKYEPPAEIKVYLTRKQAYTKLGCTGPTLDEYVRKGILPKIGRGKGARFRYQDVENIYENLDQFYYKRK